MNWKWERREKKHSAEKSREIMHGKGLKRVENDLENRKKYKSVFVGMKFSDEKHNRQLEVVRKCDIDPDYWMCQNELSNVEVLYRYKTEFILNNIKFGF